MMGDQQPVAGQGIAPVAHQFALPGTLDIARQQQSMTRSLLSAARRNCRCWRWSAPAAGDRNWKCCPPGQRQACPARQGRPRSRPGTAAVIAHGPTGRASSIVPAPALWSASG